MRALLLAPLLLGVVLLSCTVTNREEAIEIEQLNLPLAELVKIAAPKSHAGQSFFVGGSEGMTREYGYPFHQYQYDARIVLNKEEAEGFTERLAAGIEATIKADGLRITGRSEGDEHRGFLYHGRGKRGTLDLYTILDAEHSTRILILISEQPYQG